MSKDYEPVIGLEVHIQLKTMSKLFCSCPTDYGAAENTQICPVCTGYPGSLPVLNKGALALALKMALGLQCRINRKIIFERKNYFYPDLPKNYQISQYALPLGEKGFLEISVEGIKKKIRITRVHMEEDAGKLVHGEKNSYADYNRTGIPLAEIVTEPDIASADEAYAYLSELKLLARHLGVSECDMEKGFLRCDANISVRPKGTTALGTKTELKNINSFKNVRDALEYEIKRQIQAVSDGEKIVQSTLLWDDKSRKTCLMRTKEAAHDYRYFPDPDLVIFEIDQELITAVGKQITSKPQELRVQMQEKFALAEKNIELLLQDPWLTAFFMECASGYADYKKLFNFISGPLLELVNAEGNSFLSIKVSPAHFVKVIQMVDGALLNNLTSKEVLRTILFNDEDPQKVAERLGVIQVSNEDELLAKVDAAIKNNPKPVSDFCNGKEQALMFLVGQVMKEMKGKSNPKVLRELFERRIKNG